MAEKHIKSFNDFSGGQNSFHDPRHIQENEYQRLFNVWAYNGALQTRPLFVPTSVNFDGGVVIDYKKYEALDGRIQHIFIVQYERQDASENCPITTPPFCPVDEYPFYYVSYYLEDGENEPAILLSWDCVSTTKGFLPERPFLIIHQNRLWLFKYGYYTRIWDGDVMFSTGDWGISGLMPSGSYAENVGERIYYTRNRDYPQRIWYNRVFDDSGSFAPASEKDAWTEGLYIDIPITNERVIGIKEYWGDLYIFTDKRIWVLKGEDAVTGIIKSLTGSIGAVDSHLIQKTPFGILFLGNDGEIHLFNGQISDIGKNIADIRILKSFYGAVTGGEARRISYDTAEDWQSLILDGTGIERLYSAERTQDGRIILGERFGTIWRYESGLATPPKFTNNKWDVIKARVHNDARSVKRWSPLHQHDETTDTAIDVPAGWNKTPELYIEQNMSIPLGEISVYKGQKIRGIIRDIMVGEQIIFYGSDAIGVDEKRAALARRRIDSSCPESETSIENTLYADIEIEIVIDSTTYTLTTTDISWGETDNGKGSLSFEKEITDTHKDKTAVINIKKKMKFITQIDPVPTMHFLYYYTWLFNKGYASSDDEIASHRVLKANGETKVCDTDGHCWKPTWHGNPSDTMTYGLIPASVFIDGAAVGNISLSNARDISKIATDKTEDVEIYIKDATSSDWVKIDDGIINYPVQGDTTLDIKITNKKTKMNILDFISSLSLYYSSIINKENPEIIFNYSYHSPTFDTSFFMITSDKKDGLYPTKTILYRAKGGWAEWDLQATVIYEHKGLLYIARRDGRIYKMDDGDVLGNIVIYDEKNEWGAIGG